LACGGNRAAHGLGERLVRLVFPVTIGEASRIWCELLKRPLLLQFASFDPDLLLLTPGITAHALETAFDRATKARQIQFHDRVLERLGAAGSRMTTTLVYAWEPEIAWLETTQISLVSHQMFLPTEIRRRRPLQNVMEQYRRRAAIDPTVSDDALKRIASTDSDSLYAFSRWRRYHGGGMEGAY